MTIDTGPRAMRLQFLKLILMIVSVVTIMLMYMPYVSVHVDALGIPSGWVIWFAALVMVGYMLWFIVRDLEYVLVTDEHIRGILLVRHFKLRPFAAGRHAIEIPIEQLQGFRFVRRFWGLRQSVVLLQQVEGRLYQYPAFSVTLLRRRERSALADWLHRHTV